jgi:D-3-phosphoglycerate dehydrogenase
VPFGEPDSRPVDSLRSEGIDYTVNPLGRKLQPSEVAGVIGNHSIAIAGTEPITAEVMDACPNLRAICRVGIGLDSVDLIAARERGIAVSYTPDAPSGAVAELTIGLMIDTARGISGADRGLRRGDWMRSLGRRLGASRIGVVGVGRIGGRVIRHLAGGFPGVDIFAHDINPDGALDDFVQWCDLKTILRECDIVSLHLPLTPETRDLIGADALATMRRDGILINTARGGIVNETDLADALNSGAIAGAAVDVFEVEPYKGPLATAANIVLTCHMGSMTHDCRTRMEIEATNDAIMFSRGKPFTSPVPEDEYSLAARRTKAS